MAEGPNHDQLNLYGNLFAISIKNELKCYKSKFLRSFG